MIVPSILLFLLFTVVFFFQSYVLSLLIHWYKLEKRPYGTVLLVWIAFVISGVIIGGIFYSAGIFPPNSTLILLFSFPVFHFLLKKYFTSTLGKNIKIYLFLFISTLIFSTIFILFIRVFFIQSFYITGDAMKPLFQNKEYAFFKRFHTTVKRNDIIVFKSPEGGRLLRKVVGLPGEKIQIREGKLLIENNLIASKLEKENFSIELQTNEYFVLAENQTGSDTKDSLDFGPIHRSAIVGVYWFSPTWFNEQKKN